MFNNRIKTEQIHKIYSAPLNYMIKELKKPLGIRHII